MDGISLHIKRLCVIERVDGTSEGLNGGQKAERTLSPLNRSESSGA